jgi:hypothetical protein
MADALPPNQAQIVVLKSLQGDVNRVLQAARPKGAGVTPATVVEVRRWLADAAKSADDAPLPLEGTLTPSVEEPYLDRDGVVASVKELGTRFEARSQQLAKEPALASVPLDAWLTQTVLEVTKARVHKKVKGGQVKAASLDELKAWLANAGFEAGTK